MKTSKAELERRRKAWAEEEERDRREEAERANMPLSPVQEFLERSIGPDPDTDGNTHHKVCRAICDLIASDVPLDQDTRQELAKLLRSVLLPRPTPRVTDEDILNFVKAALREQGKTALEAELEIAESMDISLDALRKRLQRSE